MIKKFALALTATLALSSAAAAVTVTTGGTATPGALPTPDSTIGIVLHNTTGSIPNIAKSPWGTTNTTDPYTAALKDSAAIYDYSIQQRGLSLLWGSVDAYNGIRFFLNGSMVHQLTGKWLINNGYVARQSDSVINITGLVFDRVLLGSKGYSFEFAALDTTAVPLPAGLGLMLAALGGTGLLALRRRRRG